MMENYKIDVAVLCLFFNRPEQFRQVFEQVKKARPSKLFLYQDGPRDNKDLAGIQACRDIVNDIDWNCEVHKLYQESNFGCDPSEFISQKWAFSYVDKCIVLEDDDVPAVSFFSFCKELLDKYENDERITMISGINYEEETKKCPYSYLFTSDCAIWGWASWKRVIDRWHGNYEFLEDEYHMQLLSKYINDSKQRKSLIPMFKRHKAANKEYYESILIANHLLSHGLAIVPSKNLITNIGMTADSTHFNGSIKTVPKSVSRIFTMKRFEIELPLTHPKYVIENLYYKKSVDKILARNRPFVILWRQLKTLMLRIWYGDFISIVRSFKNRL